MKYTLRMLHASKFWTQAQAAKEIGVSTENWGNWERKRSYPYVPNISKIEQVFNVAYDDIIFLTDYGKTVIKCRARKEEEQMTEK